MKITGHAYDCGPVNTGAPCIADVGGLTDCGEPEYKHRYSEYVDGPAAGDMHEPKEYSGDLDWSDNTILDH